MTNEELLEAYRSTWNNRILKDETKTAEQILYDAIERELLDLSTHPRLRKSKEEKFFYGIKRIMESSNHETAKLALIKLYIKLMQEL